MRRERSWRTGVDDGDPAAWPAEYEGGARARPRRRRPPHVIAAVSMGSTVPERPTTDNFVAVSGNGQ